MLHRIPGAIKKIGTAARYAIGVAGATVPLLNGINTWANAQTFTTAPVFTDVPGSRTALGVAPGNPQGRLTFATLTPVMSADVTSSTIYYTPFVGQFCPLYDGTNWKMVDLGGELSQATTDATKSPAACVASTNYDLFVWNDSGTYRCTRGPAWSNSGIGGSLRGTGVGTTELQTMANGLYTNKNAITPGPAANRGTYVGTVRTNGISTMTWSLGPSGGGAAFIFVWNAYNRVPAPVFVRDVTVSWAYTSATYRYANGNSQYGVYFVRGLDTDGYVVSYETRIQAAAASGYMIIAVSLNNASNPVGVLAIGRVTGASADTSMTSTYTGLPGIGYGSLTACESGDSANANVAYGTPYGGLYGNLLY